MLGLDYGSYMNQVENETENGGVKGLGLGKGKAPVISNQLRFTVQGIELHNCYYREHWCLVKCLPGVLVWWLFCWFVVLGVSQEPRTPCLRNIPLIVLGIPSIM